MRKLDAVEVPHFDPLASFVREQLPALLVKPEKNTLWESRDSFISGIHARTPFIGGNRSGTTTRVVRSQNSKTPPHLESIQLPSPVGNSLLQLSKPSGINPWTRYCIPSRRFGTNFRIRHTPIVIEENFCSGWVKMMKQWRPWRALSKGFVRWGFIGKAAVLLHQGNSKGAFRNRRLPPRICSSARCYVPRVPGRAFSAGRKMEGSKEPPPRQSGSSREGTRLP